MTPKVNETPKTIKIIEEIKNNSMLMLELSIFKFIHKVTTI